MDKIKIKFLDKNTGNEFHSHLLKKEGNNQNLFQNLETSLEEFENLLINELVTNTPGFLVHPSKILIEYQLPEDKVLKSQLSSQQEEILDQIKSFLDYSPNPKQVSHLKNEILNLLS